MTALGDLQVRRVELYSDGLRLYWHRRRYGDEAPDAERMSSRSLGSARTKDLPPRPLPDVHDDLGMRYESFGASPDGTAGQQSPLVEFERATYTPAVQAGAGHLEVSHRGTVVGLPLEP